MENGNSGVDNKISTSVASPLVDSSDKKPAEADGKLTVLFYEPFIK